GGWGGLAGLGGGRPGGGPSCPAGPAGRPGRRAPAPNRDNPPPPHRGPATPPRPGQICPRAGQPCSATPLKEGTFAGQGRSRRLDRFWAEMVPSGKRNFLGTASTLQVCPPGFFWNPVGKSGLIVITAKRRF